jgi:hypothetical protein
MEHELQELQLIPSAHGKIHSGGPRNRRPPGCVVLGKALGMARATTASFDGLTDTAAGNH